MVMQCRMKLAMQYSHKPNRVEANFRFPVTQHQDGLFNVDNNMHCLSSDAEKLILLAISSIRHYADAEGAEAC